MGIMGCIIISEIQERVRLLAALPVCVKTVESILN